MVVEADSPCSGQSFLLCPGPSLMPDTEEWDTFGCQLITGKLGIFEGQGRNAVGGCSVLPDLRGQCEVTAAPLTACSGNKLSDGSQGGICPCL